MRVVLGVDGSTSSEQAATLVANLAWPPGTTIKVVTAYPGTATLFDPGAPGMTAEVMQQSEAAMEAEARRVAIHVVRRLAAPDLTVEAHVIRARAATEIMLQAEGCDADLIVLGARGYGPSESAGLGSVAAEVVEHGRRPVLVARRDRAKRILLAVDGSDSAVAATDAIRKWPALHGVPVRVLSVADVDPQWNPWFGTALREAYHDAADAIHGRHEAFAREAAAHLRVAGLQVESDVVDGSPARRLIEAGVDWETDLTVIGNVAQRDAGPRLLGSVARGVLYSAPCSVLIVPWSGPPADDAPAMP